MDNFDGARARADRDRRLRRDRRAQPADDAALADTSGRRCRCPTAGEIPARGAALFGAVAAGAFADIGAAVAGDPARERVGPTRPTRTPGATYDRVYAIYRDLHDLLGRSQVELLHELKRIRTTERRAA